MVYGYGRFAQFKRYQRPETTLNERSIIIHLTGGRASVVERAIRAIKEIAYPRLEHDEKKGKNLEFERLFAASSLAIVIMTWFILRSR